MTYMGKGRRGIIVAVLTVVVLGVFGAVLHSPIDALGGASARKARTETRLGGDYVLLLSAQSEGAGLQEALAESVLHRTKAVTAAQSVALTVYVPDDSDALVAYATGWASRASTDRVSIRIVPMSATMVRSRLVAAKYDMALVPASLTDGLSLPPCTSLSFKSYEMR